MYAFELLVILLLFSSNVYFYFTLCPIYSTISVFTYIQTYIDAYVRMPKSKCKISWFMSAKEQSIFTMIWRDLIKRYACMPMSGHSVIFWCVRVCVLLFVGVSCADDWVRAPKCACMYGCAYCRPSTEAVI